MTATAQTARLAAARAFSVREAHALVRDLTRPRLRTYWLDMTLSALATWASVAVLALLLAEPSTVPGGWVTVVVVVVVATIVMYRAAAFLHEIIHFRGRRGFRSFRAGWLVLVGMPLLIPAYMYEMHVEHHSTRLYGTARDGEYVAYARLSRREIVRDVLAAPLLPLFAVWRFAVLGPLSWVVRPLRGYVLTRASSIVLDKEYRARPPRPGAEARSWLVQEATVTLLVWAVVVGTVVGVVPVALVAAWLAVLAATMLVDMVRVLGAHRYLGTEEGMTVVEQMLDTVNHPRHRWLAELWGPVGLRLHALHHLLPALPYHALPEAHARLTAALPEDSAYRLTEGRSLLRTVAELWRVAGRGGAAGPGGVAGGDSATEHAHA